jgi:hypothetical protein
MDALTEVMCIFGVSLIVCEAFREEVEASFGVIGAITSPVLSRKHGTASSKEFFFPYLLTFQTSSCYCCSFVFISKRF